MKVVILCGGMGTRLAEETTVRPKPMVHVGNKPILLHIMNWYSKFNYRDFVLALGYKGVDIKEYFLNYYSLNNDFSVDLSDGKVSNLTSRPLPWKVELIDTGDVTLTGGRLLRLKEFLKNEETFMLTYGDGVANVDIKKLLEFHKKSGKIATVTAVHPVARFGELQFDGDKVRDFAEKPQTSAGWINGGFFIFESKIFDYLEDDHTILERVPLEKLAKEGELVAYKHDGFWQCMDTVRDRDLLNELWKNGEAPWA